MLRRVNKVLGQILTWAIGLIHAGVAAILLAGVITRYVFHAPLFWAEEVAILGLIWMTFLGGAVLVRKDQNVAISLLTDLLPRRLRGWVRVGEEVLTLVIIAVMIWLSWRLSQKLAFSTTPALRIPEDVFGYALVAGFGLMLFYQVQRLIARLLGREPFPEDRAAVVERGEP